MEFLRRPGIVTLFAFIVLLWGFVSFILLGVSQLAIGGSAFWLNSGGIPLIVIGIATALVSLMALVSAIRVFRNKPGGISLMKKYALASILVRAGHIYYSYRTDVKISLEWEGFILSVPVLIILFTISLKSFKVYAAATEGILTAKTAARVVPVQEGGDIEE